MNYMLLFALVLSLAMIFTLWRGDPKRRRVAGLPGAGHSIAVRRLALTVLLSPGCILAFNGDSAAFLIWFGGCAVSGWLITQTGGSRSAD